MSQQVTLSLGQGMSNQGQGHHGASNFPSLQAVQTVKYYDSSLENDRKLIFRVSFYLVTI